MKKLQLLFIITLLAIFVSACGGGGGGSTAVSPSNTNSDSNTVADPAPIVPATVAVVITDASINDYDKALATITSIELLGDSGHVQIFSGSETVDFLQLSDFVELFVVDGNVPPGDYDKIRLRLSNMTLVNVVDGGDDIETHVDLVANGKVDLNPQGTFTLLPGQVVFISIDFDLEKSLKLTETGKGSIKLRPVIFVEIGTTPAFKDGLARVHGVVDGIADDLASFRMCMTQLISRFPPGDGASIDGFCLTVRLDEKTGLFAKDGSPMMASELSIGQELTVVGILGLGDGGPMPTPLPEDSSDDGDDVDAFAMDAIVVEAGPLGTWIRLRGQLKSPVDDKTGFFGLFVFPEQGFPDDTVLTTQVFPKTRIYRIDDSGLREITAAELMTEDHAVLDGVLIPADVSTDQDDDVLRSALMLTTPASTTPPEAEVIKGKILTIDAEAQSLMVATEEGDRCVSTDDETLIFEVFLIDKVFESVKVMLGDLSEGSGVGIYGVDDGVNCFAADLIIAEGQIDVDPEPK